MIDGGGGNGGGPMAKYGSTVPLLLAQAIESLRAVGFDLPSVLNANGHTSSSGVNGNANGHSQLDELAAEVDARTTPPLDPPAERAEAPGL